MIEHKHKGNSNKFSYFGLTIIYNKVSSSMKN